MTLSKTTTLNNMMQGFPQNFRMGVNNGRGVMLRRPSWDCDWYWGFGYLGNSQVHYHLSSMDSLNPELTRKNLFDQLKTHFGDSLTITNDKDLWAFCEVVSTIYVLKQAAELYGRGGSHYTTNPDAELLKNEAEADRINTVLIPAQIASMYAILAKYSENN